MQRGRSRSRGRDARSPPADDTLDVLPVRRRTSQSRSRASPAKTPSVSKKKAQKKVEEVEDEPELVAKPRGRSRSPSRSGSRARAQPTPRAEPKPRSRSRARKTQDSDEEEVAEPIEPTETPMRRRGGRVGSDESTLVLHVRSPPPPTPQTSKILREKYLATQVSTQVTQPLPSQPPVVAKPSSSILMTALIVGLYFVSSIGVVFLNKALFLDPKFAPFTLTVTVIQMIGSVVIAMFLGSLAPFFTPITPSFVNFFPRITIRGNLLSQTLMTAAFFAITLSMNNICLQLVDISFYQVARAWTIICSLVLSYLFVRSEPFPPAKTLACCAVIVGGYVVAVIGKRGLAINDLKFELTEQYHTCVAAMQTIWSVGLTPICSNVKTLVQACAPRPRLLGLVFGFLGSLFLAAYSLLVKRDLRRLPISNPVLAVHANLSAAILLTLYTIASGETSHFLAAFPSWQDRLSAIIAVMPVTIVGFLVSIATFLQISHTSALTHNVSGTAKASLQSVLGWVMHEEEISGVTAVGTAINVLGCMAYGAVSQAHEASKVRQPSEKPIGRVWTHVDEVPYSCLFRKVAKFGYRFVHAPPTPKDVAGTY